MAADRDRSDHRHLYPPVGITGPPEKSVVLLVRVRDDLTVP